MDYTFLIIAIPLILGYLLDLLLGDPRWLPHPIRLFGTVIHKAEIVLNKGKHKFWKGGFLVIGLCVIVYSFFQDCQKFFWNVNTPCYFFFTGIFVFYGLANKSLLQEGKEVFNELKEKGLEAGRKRLAWIVGRDTNSLNENQVRIAVLETLSENLSDGVIAPLFYYAIGGLPLMMVYKMINTLDSMIGYKNDRYFYFGKVAARLDDVANFIPARMTALLMVLLTFSKRGLLFIFKYGSRHSSPNSGYPEAALAGIMNCRFGGSNTYQGKLVVKPYIGDNDRVIEHKELQVIFYIHHAATALMVLAILLIRFVIQ